MEPNELMMPSTRILDKAAGVLAGLVMVLISMALLVKVAVVVGGSGGQWTGAIGDPADSMQYLAWIREGAFHFLASDRFVVEQTPRDFFSPALLASSALFRLGVPIAWSFALWVPVALGLLMWAAWRLTAAVIPSTPGRLAAWAGGILYAFPATEIVIHTPQIYDRLGPSGRLANALVPSDAWLPGLLWGYPLGVVAVAILCAGVLVGGRAIRDGLPRPLLLCLVTFGCSLMQPWQGATLLGTLGLTWLIWRRRGSLSVSALQCAWVAAAGVIPLVYYALLGTLDAAWIWNGEQANLYFHFSWLIILFFIPLVIVALPGWFRPLSDPVDLAVRIWPLIAGTQLAVILLTGLGNSASHAARGATIPLAILAVQGFRNQRSGLTRYATGLLVAAMLVAGIYSTQSLIRSGVGRVKTDPGAGYVMSRSQVRIIDYLRENREPGAVMAPQIFSALIAAHSDRNVWLGHYTWTEDYLSRASAAGWFYSPGQEPDARRAYLAVLSKVRFVVAPCEPAGLVQPRVLVKQLKTVTVSVKWLGCDAVLTIRPGL
ncbi:unannotated protein [freshwater metagenome]|uniref:Unannotated protein n=1 Tax=freshwater metagenome TaxID=449393 RepID=A0A6J7E0Y9_9ZZZZ